MEKHEKGIYFVGCNGNGRE